MKLKQSLTPYTKINSKQIKDLHVIPDTIKLLEENIEHSVKEIAAIFFYLSPTVMEIKGKINKLDLTKLKNFCIAKEIINKKVTYRIGEDICK